MSALNGTGRVEPAKAPAPDLLHPLRHTGFTLIAGATLVSNVGVWMRDTTSAWTVAGAAHNHSAVALVQAATALPTFLLALPAGVLADHFDRRRLLILCQLALVAVGAALAVLSYAHALTVEMIVVLAFLAGSAAALAGFALAVAGGSTLIQLATSNGTAQLMLPEAIRGRGLAIYMAATFGCMAVGSLLWGAVSNVFSIGAALAVGALGFALTALVGWTSPLAAAPGTAPAGTAS